ncbi:uncharacterized protein LOC141645569 [Silene latifolia]|uniref:uncharacterized protein LOC141645569 n=1 Tax=Silene latifolia TaxID=37657 RepID=UPI003D76CE2E
MARSKKAQNNSKKLNTSGKKLTGRYSILKEEINEIEETVPLNSKKPARRLLPYDLELDLDDIPEVEEELEEVVDAEIFQKEDGTWTEVMSKKLKQQMKKPEPKSHSQVLVQLSDDDVAPEINYWKTAIYGYILGANPPWNVVDGFMRRVWSKCDVDKVSFLPNGIFLVHFKTLEMQQKALQSEQLMFDNKPVFIHEWNADAELVKQEISEVPIWIKLVGLELKFWGPNALKKISGIIGEYLRCDDATMHKTLLSYAKILVKVKMDQKFPSSVDFMDEKGKLQTIKVEYDWLPLKCSQCNGMGHLAASCRKPEEKGKVKHRVITKQVWRPVVKASQPVVPPAKFDGKEKIITGKSPTVTTPKVMRAPITPSRILTRIKSQDIGIDSIPGKATFMEVFNTAVQKSVQMAKGGLSSGRLRLEKRVEEGFDVNIEDITSQTIHAFVKDKINGRAFWFTCVYGFNDQGLRSVLWDSLKSYSHHCLGAWAIGGDFNNVLAYQERIGGEVSLAEIQPFQECIKYCQVQDIKAICSFFTWNKKQGGITRKYSRLDRFLVNEDWLSVFPDAYANFMPEGIFYHCPCVVQFGMTVQRKKVPFKYYNMWSLADDYNQIVDTVWSEQVDGTLMYQLVSKLKKLKGPLKSLNKHGFSDIENTASITFLALQKIQQDLRANPSDPTLIQTEREVAKEYTMLLNAKHQFLQQKTKAEWALEGDDNTAYFHASLKAKRNRSKVVQIEDGYGECKTSPDEINGAFEDFFIQLLGTS